MTGEFKESGHKQLIIRPLNAIFGLDIADIDIRESEQLGLTDQERTFLHYRGAAC